MRPAGEADPVTRQTGRSPQAGFADADPETVARAVCLRLLTDRARTRAELAGALRRRGVPEPVTEQVLGRFSDVGLIDDAAFAEQWVHSRHQSRGLGRRALASELRRKGVDGEVAGRAVAALDREQEQRRARELVDKRLRGVDATDPKAVNRLVAMLARKGYPAGLAYQVVRDALREHGAEDLPDEVDFD